MVEETMTVNDLFLQINSLRSEFDATNKKLNNLAIAHEDTRNQTAEAQRLTLLYQEKVACALKKINIVHQEEQEKQSVVRMTQVQIESLRKANEEMEKEILVLESSLLLERSKFIVDMEGFKTNHTAEFTNLQRQYKSDLTTHNSQINLLRSTIQTISASNCSCAETVAQTQQLQQICSDFNSEISSINFQILILTLI
eukprot:TRINITY_DN5830_c0_g1_i3.p1 TRINITY_DN5830_c0_g1~~TRINITY_DN5830_c0_g1_i3.p1  ORF type:complete len:198 (+),score=44.30 TRINITY_DN5830_c0_g1_i3:39-632(+)